MHLRTVVRLFTCVAILSACATAYAVEPAYRGERGNLEEPALRPYKWLWRGTKAFLYQTGTAFKEGNEDFPIVGSVYAFRGMRVGIIEWERSLVCGLTGVNPKSGKDTDYKKTGEANEIIEGEPFLRNAADLATAVYAAGVLSGSSTLMPEAAAMGVEAAGADGAAAAAGVAAFAGQKVLDRSTPVPEWKPVSEWKKPENEVARAQRQYIGDRAKINDKRSKGTGNFLRGAHKMQRQLLAER